MKVGVVSDSHGNLEYLRRACRMLIERGAEILVHLGDEIEPDSKILAEFPARSICVPGVFEKAYKDPSIPNRILTELGGLRVLITHTPESHENDLPGDLKPEEIRRERKADLILYGHTHLYDARMEEGVLLINPGHLKVSDKKGRPPSFALLDIEGRRAKVEILGMNGEVLLEKTFELAGRG